MKKMLIAFMFLAVACAPMDDEGTEGAPESDEAPDVDSKKEALWCFNMPYETLAFPVDQGSWIGSSAGQIMRPLWGDVGPSCPPLGYEAAYFQDDGQINLIKNVGWAPNTCYKSNNSTVVCNGQAFPCPVNACLTLPAMWQLSASAPDNAQVWGWSNPNYSAAPGNHGIWPKYSQQCSNGAPTIQFTPNGSGGTSLSCQYPMPAFVLRQF